MADIILSGVMGVVFGFCLVLFVGWVEKDRGTDKSGWL